MLARVSTQPDTVDRQSSPTAIKGRRVKERIFIYCHLLIFCRCKIRRIYSPFCVACRATLTTWRPIRCRLDITWPLSVCVRDEACHTWACWWGVRAGSTERTCRRRRWASWRCCVAPRWLPARRRPTWTGVASHQYDETPSFYAALHTHALVSPLMHEVAITLTWNNGVRRHTGLTRGLTLGRSGAQAWAPDRTGVQFKDHGLRQYGAEPHYSTLPFWQLCALKG